ncbi:MAG: sel1 repeat family protein [Bacteroidales bacterium]|nr:sel1 repeat family protein [Bacteroidales bacterium]
MGRYYCTKAFEYIEDNALHGDPKCQWMLGAWYRGGNKYFYFGNQPDFEKAAYWWNEAAQNGYVKAYNSIGIAYKEGRGVPKDLRKAVYWIKKGAEEGDSLAMRNYGDMWRDGVYEDHSYYKRKKSYYYGYWYGDYEDVYVKKIEVILANDIKKAKYWWKKSADLGDKQAKERLQKIYYIYKDNTQRDLISQTPSIPE